MPGKYDHRVAKGNLLGPPEPINDRIRLKLLVSEQLRIRKGVGTQVDLTNRNMDRKYA